MKTAYFPILLFCLIFISADKGYSNESKWQLRDSTIEEIEFENSIIKHPELHFMNSDLNLTRKQQVKLAFRARNGDGKAANQLYMYYACVANDRLESIFWLRMAAGLHYPMAEYNLGNTYFSLGSVGLAHSIEERDLPRAKYWFLRAKSDGLPRAKDGFPDAESKLKEIEALETKSK